MADVKISGLPASTTPLDGTEVLPIVQGTTTKQVSITNVTAGRAINALSFTSTNDGAINGLTIGKGAGNVATNTVLGASALATNSSGASLTAIGYQSLNKTTGSNSTAAGAQAAFNNTSATIDAFGWQAGYSNTTGAANVYLGAQAGYTSSVGVNNTGVGSGTLYASTASYNTGVGFNAFRFNTSGNYGTAIGMQSLYQNTTGSNNTALGYRAGYGNASANANTTGSNNTYLGFQTVGSANNNTNEMVIGYSAIGLGSNTTIIGNSSTTGTYNGNNSAAWSITSDARIKKNVVSLESGLDVISNLRPVEFDYIENDKHDIGFIAQEYQTVLPTQIIEQDNGMLGLNQNLVPYLVKALQELNEKFDAYAASHP